MSRLCAALNLKPRPVSLGRFAGLYFDVPFSLARPADATEVLSLPSFRLPNYISAKSLDIFSDSANSVPMVKQASPIRKSSLDDLDHKIIAILQEDGRLSASEVASRIGKVAERTVRNRIASLLQLRHIVVSAIPDPTSVGQDVQADLLIETAPGQSDTVAHRIVEFDQVSYLCAMTGEYNLGASIMADSNADLHHFIETEISTIPGVRRVNTMMVMRLYKVFNTRTTALAHSKAYNG